MCRQESAQEKKSCRKHTPSHAYRKILTKHTCMKTKYLQPSVYQPAHTAAWSCQSSSGLILNKHKDIRRGQGQPPQGLSFDFHRDHKTLHELFLLQLQVQIHTKLHMLQCAPLTLIGLIGHLASKTWPQKGFPNLI